MNNDISGDLANHISTRTRNMQREKEAVEAPKLQSDEVMPKDSYELTQKCCDVLSRAKVSMDNGVSDRVKKSVGKFKEDPEYAEAYNHWCDALKEKGYSLEDASVGADILMNELKKETTYRP